MFYDIFKRLCNERDTTPTAVGRRVGIARNTIRNWHARGSIPNPATLQAIANELGVTVSALLVDERDVDRDPRRAVKDKIDGLTENEFHRMLDMLRLLMPDKF